MSVKSNPSMGVHADGSKISDTATSRAYDHPCKAEPVNPSTAQATVIVDELVRNGVRHVVLCPDSRNAALAIALHQAADEARLTMHVRIDERSAAFLALGLSRMGCPAVVACTSRTG